MTTAMAEQSWLTHSPKPRDTLPLAPSNLEGELLNLEGELLNLEGELLNLEGEQPLSQSVNSYGWWFWWRIFSTKTVKSHQN